VHVGVVHPLEIHLAYRYVRERRRDSDDKILRYIRVYQSLAHKRTFSCSQPVLAPRCLPADFEDVLEHLDTLKITAVEPAEPPLFLECEDHGFDPLSFVIGSNKPSHLGWHNCAGETMV